METKTVAFFRQGLGNFIEMTPALRAMASMDESGKLDLCTDQVWTDYRKQALVDLCERLPFVNKVVVGEDITDAKYKTWFWAPWACYGKCPLFQSKKPYPPPKWNKNKVHESDYYMDIARKIYGYRGEKPRQMVTTADGPLVDKKGGKLIVLCNGGFGHYSVFKRWDGFANFSRTVKSYYPNCLVAAVGIESELSGVPVDLNYLGKLKFTETAKVIQQADILVTTDTGNMHVADALGIPMIVLWGGSYLAKNRPYEAPNKIIYLGLKCQPCTSRLGYRTCRDFRCIRHISIGEVMYHIRNFFNKGRFDDTELGAFGCS